MASLMLASSGCSFVFVHGPPSPPVSPYAKVDCTQSRVGPIFDLVAGLGAAGLGVAVLSDAAAPPPSCQNARFLCLDLRASESKGGGILLGLGAVALTASAVGFYKTHRCQEVMALRRACLGGDPAACQRLALSPVPPPGLGAPPLPSR